MEDPKSESLLEALKRLQQQKTLVVFDGFDESSISEAAEMLAILRDANQKLSNLRVVLTTRASAIEAQKELPNQIKRAILQDPILQAVERTVLQDPVLKVAHRQPKEESSDPRVEFTHSTFMEYLAAEAFSNLIQDETDSDAIKQELSQLVSKIDKASIQISETQSVIRNLKEDTRQDLIELEGVISRL